MGELFECGDRELLETGLLAAGGLLKRHARQNLESIFEVFDRRDLETAGANGVDDLFVEHQVAHVAARDHDLVEGIGIAGLAHAKEAFDLLVHAADSLGRAELIDRACQCHILTKGHARQRRQQRAAFGHRSAVAIDVGVALLHAQHGLQTQRRVLTEAVQQDALEDHRAFGVDWSAELGLTLDVDDLAFARANATSDAGRHAKRVAAEVDHGQAVDLANDAAARLDVDPTLGDVVAHLELDEAFALGTRRQGALHVRSVNFGRLFLLGVERRFTHEVGDVAEARRELVLIVAKTCRVFEHATSAVEAEGQQVLFGGEPGEKAHVVAQPIGVARHLGLEVDLDLEQLAEIGIAARQRIVKLGRANEHDLQAELDRLWSQRRHRHHSTGLTRVVEFDLPVLQGALDAFPRRRITQQVGGVQQQVATVGAVEGAGLDACEIRRGLTRTHLVLDAANQVRQRRQRL